MSIVPDEWTRVLGNLHAAQIERDCMRSPMADQQMRDEATARYTRLVDQIIEDLGTLSVRLVLGRITAFLCRKERV